MWASHSVELMLYLDMGEQDMAPYRVPCSHPTAPPQSQMSLGSHRGGSGHPFRPTCYLSGVQPFPNCLTVLSSASGMGQM